MHVRAAFLILPPLQLERRFLRPSEDWNDGPAEIAVFERGFKNVFALDGRLIGRAVGRVRRGQQRRCRLVIHNCDSFRALFRSSLPVDRARQATTAWSHGSAGFSSSRRATSSAKSLGTSAALACSRAASSNSAEWSRMYFA